MDITWGHQKKSIDLSCELVSEFLIKENMTVSEQEEDNTITLKIEFHEDDEKEYFVSEICNKIDSSFYKDIYSSLRNIIKEEISNKVAVNIDYFIKEYLNSEVQLNTFNPFEDSFFIKDFERIKNKINIEIVSDVIKPF